jgi:preprotein translocase subunit SecG
VLLASIWSWPWWLALLLNVAVLLVGIFLILLVLIQRGKGGGLVGAFGGAGGSSAFGSRAGDKFMWFTVYVAVAWFSLILVQVKVVQATGTQQTGTFGASGPSNP